MRKNVAATATTATIQKNESGSKEELLAALDTIAALKEKFKADYIIDVMLGKSTNDVKSYHHDELEVFGSAEGRDRRFLNAVLRQAILSGYLNKDIENYGTLHLTSKGKDYMKKPVSFKIVEDTEFGEEDEEITPMKSGSACAADPELLRYSPHSAKTWLSTSTCHPM